MPSNRVIETIYLGQFSSIDKMHVASLYKPGELGARVAVNNTEWQIVQLDSGATASAPAGIAAVGQAAYWKDKSKYLVTNDMTQAVGAAAGARNEVAGVIQVAAAAGEYLAVQQKGRSVNVVKTKSGSPNIGDWLVADNTASTAQFDVVAIATAPTVRSYGVYAAAGSSTTTATVDLDIPGIP